MKIKNIIEHVFVDCIITVDMGIEENNTYYTKKMYEGTAANVPHEWYDKEIFLIIPEENGRLKIVTR